MDPAPGDLLVAPTGTLWFVIEPHPNEDGHRIVSEYGVTLTGADADKVLGTLLVLRAKHRATGSAAGR